MSESIRAHAISRWSLALAILVPAVAWSAPPDWTRWGGPSQDFRAPAEGIATSWPADGPEQLWTRELGDGYSTVLVDGGVLYTMYRTEDQEAVIALDAKTGKTVWERRYDHDPDENHVSQFGTGPRATPLISGDLIYTIGVAGRMHCLDKTSGEIRWSHDLWGDEFGGNVLPHGYASSPIEYGDTVVALVGGEGKGIVAFDKKDGSIAWKSLDFGNSYSTPQVMTVDGEEQLVTFMAKHLIGVHPGNGELLLELPGRKSVGPEHLAADPGRRAVPVHVITAGRGAWIEVVAQRGGRNGDRGAVVDTEGPVLPRDQRRRERLRLRFQRWWCTELHVRDQREDR